MNIHETYMQRCIQLAKLGTGNVAPNPMVGAVLVYENEIIGEGYHMQYGQAHAEVNCINSVPENLKSQISNSTLYVSLEPCAHFGKTPPCANLIIQQQIKKVVIGCRDSFKQVDGKGIEQLKTAGVDVVIDVLKEECIELNKRFFTFHNHRRPYIILKFAQTADGFIGEAIPSSSKWGELERLLISNEFTNKLVHQWRSEEAAILVGTNTALFDNPSLTNRFWTGKNPLRLVIDKQLKLPSTLQLFNQQEKTVVFNLLKNEINQQLEYVQLNTTDSVIQQIIQYCYSHNIQSILVEGGTQLLQSFIDGNLWDEARIITNEQLFVQVGVTAPKLSGLLQHSTHIFGDRIDFYTNHLHD
ncbi:MAG: bifunctional diaminohydroxyphosphoribosylaminopyrimidine deaminase/5-amino-6-(5-phosphoribosylamino)uracil reductase RibD [Chitinophagaceae bacterium]|nr:bifunctional diaminohydroxyphosphoribosylaminopyrimidine deaminase/5-amino-6-(5-phosphoribosylamino)uracil reductase RibD [Chitinophagaceae bacterium]